MRHDLQGIVFAQGWLGSELEKIAGEQTDTANKALGEKILEVWKIVDEGLDDLIAENRRLRQKVMAGQNALNG